MQFNPDRFLDKTSMNANKLDYLWPFGAGNKNCIGMRLATIEIKYLLVKMLLSYDVYKPKNMKKELLSMRGFQTIKELTLGFRKRNSSS